MDVHDVLRLGGSNRNVFVGITTADTHTLTIGVYVYGRRAISQTKMHRMMIAFCFCSCSQPTVKESAFQLLLLHIPVFYFGDTHMARGDIIQRIDPSATTTVRI